MTFMNKFREYFTLILLSIGYLLMKIIQFVAAMLFLIVIIFVAGLFDSLCTNNSHTNNREENYTGQSEMSQGYECSGDCSGHEAGNEWAEENEIQDVDDCDGNSESFNEGCRAYVEENY